MWRAPRAGARPLLATAPIRLRLTLAFAAGMAIVLVAAGAVIDLRVRAGLDAGITSGLRARTDDVAALLGSTSRPLSATRGPRTTDRGETFAQVLDPNGHVVDATPGAGGRPLVARVTVRRASAGRVAIGRVASADGEGAARLLASPVRARGRTVVVVAGAGLEARDETLATLMTVLVAAGVAALALASGAGYWVATRALRPVEAMRAAAARISGSDPGVRLPVPATRDEIGRLGSTLNAMLARREQALLRERRFVEEASHDLRTPLAILIGEVDLARRSNRSAEERRAALEAIAAEAGRLDRIVSDLTVLARSDRRALALRTESIACSELLTDTQRRFAARADAGGRSLRVDLDWQGAVRADRSSAERALANLVENALAHGAGDITLVARPRGSEVALLVRDRGPGLPAGFAAVAFDRFTRADPSRRGGDGSGLGLAIVAAIAAAHGGTHGAGQPADGRGAEIWFTLPQSGNGKLGAPR